jgi:hypothetical protein
MIMRFPVYITGDNAQQAKMKPTQTRSDAQLQNSNMTRASYIRFTPIHIRPSRERRPIVKVVLNLKLIVPAQLRDVSPFE